MLYFGKQKKHPISGVWYTPMEKVPKAEICFKFVLNGYNFFRTRGKNDYVCWEKLQDAESIADFVTLRGKNCCVIKF